MKKPLLKILVIVAGCCAVSTAFAAPSASYSQKNMASYFSLKDLTLADFRLIQSYLNEQNLNYFTGSRNAPRNANYTKEKYAAPPGKVINFSLNGTSPDRVEYVDNILDLRTIKKMNNELLTREFLSEACGIEMTNIYFSDNNIDIKIPYEGTCYTYANGEVTTKGFLSSSTEVVQYRQRIDPRVITNNPMSCANSHGCSNEDNDYDIRPADVTDLYNTLLTYSKKCKTKACKIDLGLLANDKSQFKNEIDTWVIPPEQETIKTPTKVILDAVTKNVMREHNRKWELASALFGQLNAFACSQKIQNEGFELSEDTMDACMRILRNANTWNGVKYEQTRYAEGLNDGYNVILKYKPNISQSNQAYNLINQYSRKFEARGELQGYY